MNGTTLEKQIAEQLGIDTNPVTREEYEALNAKLDMYIRCQNQREKDFNELERKVYQMEQERYSPSVLSLHDTNPHSVTMTERGQHETLYGNGTAGVAWLR